MMQFKTVGEGTEKEGAAMSLKLLSTTITWVAHGNHLKGKVIGLSIKDRCHFAAGHLANWAFWYSSTGSFISSTFYGKPAKLGDGIQPRKKVYELH
jgi:hypothetical protein